MRFDSLKVMIVEDQQEFRNMLRHMLGEIGVNQVFEASDGKSAFMFMDEAMDMIDIILCDWNLPSMTGVEILRQLRTVNPDMPFLMITGRGDFDSVLEAKESGVTAYIRKPFSLRQLEEKLRIVLQRKVA